MTPVCRWVWRWVRPKMTDESFAFAVCLGWSLTFIVSEVLHSYGKTTFDPQWVIFGPMASAVLWYPARDVLHRLERLAR